MRNQKELGNRIMGENMQTLNCNPENKEGEM